MNDEFEKMEEVVVAYLKVPSSDLALGAEENREEP
jgi:hypothetical protein